MSFSKTMSFRTDSRGQSMQIGAILLFGMLVVSMSAYQATIVPEQNEAVEHRHSTQVRGEMLDVRNGMLRAGADGETHPASVALGTAYPERTVFVNPPAPSGTLRTVERGGGGIVVENATAIDGETADFWAGTDRRYESRALVYAPDYNRYGSAPTTTYENSVLVDRYDHAVVNATGQRLVDGRRIDLVALRGSLSRTASGEVAVDPVGATGDARTVAVESSAADPLTVRIPTGLPESEWRDLLAGELGGAGNVSSLSCAGADPDPCGTLTLTLEPGTYDLRVTRVDVTDVPASSPAYATDVGGDGATIPEGSSRRLVVEVRDAYNDPESGVRVNGTITDNATGGDGLDRTEATTDRSGRAAFVYEAPDDVGTTSQAEVTVEFGGGGEPAREVVFEVTVSDTGGGSAAGSSLPEGKVAYDDEDGDREYDDGEATYSTGELKTFDDGSVDLVVAKGVEASKFDVKAGSITVERLMEVTGDNSLKLTASDGPVTVADGETLLAPSVAVYADRLTLDGATVEATATSVELKARRKGAPVSADGATIVAEGAATIEASGDVDVARATVESGSDATASLNTESRTLTVTDARLRDSDDTLVYSPRGADVVGEPAEGTVSSG